MIDACDEIAYDTADLDDGYHAGLVTIEAACRASDMFRELDEAADMQFPGAPERVRMHEVVRGLIDWLVSGLLEGTVAAPRGWRMWRRCGRIPSGWCASPGDGRRRCAIEALPAGRGV